MLQHIEYTRNSMAQTLLNKLEDLIKVIIVKTTLIIGLSFFCIIANIRSSFSNDLPSVINSDIATKKESIKESKRLFGSSVMIGSNEKVLLVIHAQNTIDLELSAKPAIDKYIADFRSESKKNKIIYLITGFSKAETDAWYTENLNPDFAFSFDGFEHRIRSKSETAIIVGGYWNHCHAGAVASYIKNYQGQTINIALPMKAIFANQTQNLHQIYENKFRKNINQFWKHYGMSIAQEVYFNNKLIYKRPVYKKDKLIRFYLSDT